MNIHNLFAVLAPAVSFIAFFPYVISIFKGKTKPSAASWWTWAILAFVATISAWAGKAGWQVLLLPAWLVVSQLFVAILSIHKGDNHWDTTNKLCVGGAIISVILWIITGNPLIALGFTILSDLFGSFPNFRHVAKNPEQEDRLAWILGWVSSLFLILAIDKWDFASSSWGIYFFVNMTIIVYFLLRPRKHRG